MFRKSLVIFLAALCAFAAGELNRQERQNFPDQFNQLANKFQESFGKPQGGNPPFQLGQIPSGFGMPSGFSRRQIDSLGTIKDKVPNPLRGSPIDLGNNLPGGNPIGGALPSSYYY